MVYYIIFFTDEPTLYSVGLKVSNTKNYLGVIVEINHQTELVKIAT